MKYLKQGGLVLLLSVVVGCHEELDADWVNWPSETVTGGFDDFGSAGAALGFSVDEANGLILIAALKFNLPFYNGSFRPSGDAIESAGKYQWGMVPANLEAAVAQYPLLEFGLTDTVGVRTALDGNLVAIILEGDLNSPTPSAIYIATDGSVELTREEGPADILEGRLKFERVVPEGDTWEKLPGVKPLKFDSIYFQWSTQQSPPG